MNLTFLLLKILQSLFDMSLIHAELLVHAFLRLDFDFTMVASRSTVFGLLADWGLVVLHWFVCLVVSL